MQQQLHIVDEQTIERTAEGDSSGESLDETPVEPASHYEDAEPVSLWTAYDRDPVRFVHAVADEIGKGDLVDDLRRVDEHDLEDTDDADLAVLFAFPDESLFFLGSDPTTRDAIPLYGFCVEPFEPIPAPTSAQDALDLLRPGDVRAAFEDGDEPARQGEWWLLPTQMVPVGNHFEPGVSLRPFGPSPLGNHVPREWGMTVSDAEFMDAISERVPDLPSSITTPPEVIEWIHRQHQKVPTPDHVPGWEEVQEDAGDILVRGTLRHRENDHFVENVGEQWHEAQTHNIDVYTGDDMIDEVVID